MSPVISWISASDPHGDSSEELFSVNCHGKEGRHDERPLPDLYSEACSLILASEL